MTQLPAALLDHAVLVQDPIHGADRAEEDAFIEQGGVDLSRGLIDEPG